MFRREEALPENTVFYELYPYLGEGAVDAQTVTSVLLKTAVDCERFCGDEISGYLWHYDAWELHPQTFSRKEGFVPHLSGSLCFGDDVEDEWFVVWLLFKLTKFIPNLIARVFDADGEILLIQSADHLPRWLEDHDAKNRVFVFNGELQIIPIPTTPSEITPLASAKDPSLADALTTVRNFYSATRASDAVQEAIRGRIKKFPGRAEEELHRANVLAPARVAAVLIARPSLLAPASHAFLERDPIDMRVCRAMKHFRPEQFVKTRVTFPKCLYAMLANSRCDPDPRTGWRLPDPSSPERKEAELGVKLAWGLEILAAAGESRGPGDGEDHVTVVARDERWPKYLESLKTNGYFKGELEGSAEFERLKAEAVAFFKYYMIECGGQVRLGRRSAAGKQVCELLSCLKVDVEALTRAGASLPPSDSDSWLDVNPNELDAMLSKHFGAPKDSSKRGEGIPDSLRRFLSRMSSYEGVDLSQRSADKQAVRVKPSARGPDEKISSVSAPSNFSDRMSFDIEEFNASLKNILELDKEPASNEFDSDWSEDDESEEDHEFSLEDAMAELESVAPAGQRESDSARAMSVEQREILQIMKAMDEELMTPGGISVMGESFTRCETKTLDPKQSANAAKDADLNKPVDIDFNAMKNILESFQSQHGLPGPASTLLASIGQIDKA